MTRSPLGAVSVAMGKGVVGCTVLRTTVPSGYVVVTTGAGELDCTDGADLEAEGVREGFGDADGVECAEADGVALEETAARLTESMNSDAAPARLGQARSWRSP